MIVTAATALLYPLVIQFKRGGWRRWVCAVPAYFVFVLDLVANYTELAWALGWPLKGEYTISRRIRRTAQGLHGETPAQVRLAKAVQVYLDAFEADGKH